MRTCNTIWGTHFHPKELISMFLTSISVTIICYVFVLMSSFFSLLKDSFVGHNICYGLCMLLHAWNIYHTEVEAGASWVPCQPGYILRNCFTQRKITLKIMKKEEEEKGRWVGGGIVFVERCWLCYSSPPTVSTLLVRNQLLLILGLVRSSWALHKITSYTTVAFRLYLAWEDSIV